MLAALKHRLGGLFVALASIALALGVVAPTTALAAGTLTETSAGSLTVTNGTDVVFKDGDVVTLYKVVNTTYDAANNTVSSAWNADVVDTTKTPDFSTKWEGQTYTSTSAEVNQVVTALKANAPTAATHTIANGETSYTFDNLAMGQYLVVVETGQDASRVFENTIQSVVPVQNGTDYDAPADQTVALKGTTVTVDKKSDGKDQVTDKGVGDEVPFTITAPVPNYPKNATDLKFQFTDEMATGLELKGVENSGAFVPADFVVTVGGAAVDASSYTLTATKAGFTLAFTNDFILANGGKTVSVSYKGVITDDAAVSDPATNKVTLDYTHNPNVTDGHSTTDDNVPVVTFGIKFTKVDGTDTTKGLQGAEFKIYKSEADAKAGQNELGTATSDADGIVKFDKLGAGTYYLKETKAPTGYELREDVITVSVEDAVQSGKVTLSKDQSGKWTVTFAQGYDGYQTVTLDDNANYVKNVPSSAIKLPTTGGPGTIALTAGGVVIMAGAAFYLLHSRKGRE